MRFGRRALDEFHGVLRMNGAIISVGDHTVHTYKDSQTKIMAEEFHPISELREVPGRGQFRPLVQDGSDDVYIRLARGSAEEC